MPSPENSLLLNAQQALRLNMRNVFAEDSKRYADFTLEVNGISFDYSRHLITREIRTSLLQKAEANKLKNAIHAMFKGETVNKTENRAAFHVGLRDFSSRPLKVNGVDMRPAIENERNKFLSFAEDIRNGTIKSSSGKTFKNIVNIGIGGSDLGCVFATKALKPYAKKGLKSYFVSNVDPSHLDDVLEECAADETLFIIASKTFTTQETMMNAQTARVWLVKHLGEAAVNAHFCAVSTALKEIKAFGIDESRMFAFWDWVGGRYSLWSSIGLSLAIAIGQENYLAMQNGAYEIDKHFVNAPLDKNIPVIMALLTYFYRGFCGMPSHAVLPYDERLSRFPAFLQQLSMESLGKSVNLQGKSVETETGAILFGEAGTNGQHAFYQLLHQGTTRIPADFFVAKQNHSINTTQHKALIANCLAQVESLMSGKTLQEVKEQMLSKKVNEKDIEMIAPHRVFEGNRPTSLFIYQQLTPSILGSLISLFEHKTFCEAQLFNINAFDQWGVELGKEMANKLFPILSHKNSDLTQFDQSILGALSVLQK